MEGGYEGHPCWEDEVGVSQICGEGDRLLALWACYWRKAVVGRLMLRRPKEKKDAAEGKVSVLMVGFFRVIR